MEMPLASGAISYSLGFALATASLHGLGFLLGIAGSGTLARLAGGAIALSGVYLALV